MYWLALLLLLILLLRRIEPSKQLEVGTVASDCFLKMFDVGTVKSEWSGNDTAAIAAADSEKEESSVVAADVVMGGNQGITPPTID